MKHIALKQFSELRYQGIDLVINMTLY